MAKYAIVFFPQSNTDGVQEFRKKYDPKADLIAPHVTLVFPFPTVVNEDKVLLEIESKVFNHRGFQVRLEGVHLDPSDGFLHFLVKEGKEKVVSLHDDFYSGVLNDYWRKDLEYKPHMTLGVFNELYGDVDQTKYNKALKDLENQSLDTTFMFDNVNLIKIEDQKSPRLIIKRFSLS